MKKISTGQVGLILWVAILCLLLSACSLFSSPGTSPAATATTTPSTSTTAGATSRAVAPYDDQAQLIAIEGGSFNMGSNTLGAEADQAPEHVVQIAGFQIYSHEVTNAMYQACVRQRACTPPGLAATVLMSRFTDPAYADYPVIGVDWNMATEYCEFTGGRLPTEAEWEFAASSGIDNKYPWGNEMPTCDFLNMKGCFNPGQPTAGGSYPDGITKAGIYDMSGNTWEWVYDWYAADAYATSTSSNPAGPITGTHKTARGGGFITAPERVETTTRQLASPLQGYNDVGFRCVKNGDALPADISLPPDGHSPTTPDEGVEGDPPPDPMYLLRISGMGFDCVDPTGGSFHMGFEVSVGDATAVLTGTSVVIQSPLGDGASTACTIINLGGGDFGVACTPGLPPALTTADLPLWVEAVINLNFAGSPTPSTFSLPLELSACAPEIPGVTINASGDVSCPDAAGLVTIDIDQSHSIPPESLSFSWGGLTIDGYCTDIYASHFTCTGVPNTGIASVAMYARYPGDPMLYLHPITLAPAECPTPPASYEFSGHAICELGGGYAVVVTVTPTIPEPWKIVGLNVGIGSNVPVAADTLKGPFDTLPEGGASIQYQVCYVDPVTAGNVCNDYTTAQPVCEGPGTGYIVDLIAHGCDSGTGRFFAQFTHNIGVPNFAFLTVANNTSPMSCTDLGDAGHGLFCTSAMSPEISQVVFQYTDPAVLLSRTWTVSSEPCPTPIVPCSEYSTSESCRAHGCTWTEKLGPCY